MMTDWEEALIVELRRSLALPLDDITEAMRRCLNPALSRSAIHRCLQRHGISARLAPAKAPAAAFHTDAPAGFIHIDVKYLPPLNRRRSYAYVAIDRATRFVYLEILPDRRGQTAAGFLNRFRASFPLHIHTVLTDNGSEFTDRFAVDKKAKPPDKPSGQHPFDRLCAEHAITHRLARPFRPQTNGMVERFNRRLGDHLDRMPQNRAAHHRRFLDHAERDAYLHTFVADYNHTRLRCLDYQAPAELLAKLTGHNTQAGVAHRFMGRVGDPDRPQLAGAVQLGQHQRVAAIGLDPVACLHRKQRWRHHDAVMSATSRQSVQPVTARAGLAAEAPATAARAQSRHRFCQNLGTVFENPDLPHLAAPGRPRQAQPRSSPCPRPTQYS